MCWTDRQKVRERMELGPKKLWITKRRRLAHGTGFGDVPEQGSAHHELVVFVSQDI
jgi:hypothetical protein